MKRGFVPSGKNRTAGLKYQALLALAMLACLLLTACSSKGVTKDSDGNYETEAMAECLVADQDISYTVYLKLKTDSQGRILSVEDAGTEVPEDKNGLFKRAQRLFDQLVGKDKETLADVDIISGATCSSKAILEAVESALQAVDGVIK